MFSKNRFRIGKTVRSLSIPKVLLGGYATWHWRARFLTGFEFNPYVLHNPHMCIVGESGSGKSNLCKLLLEILASERIPFAMLDPHDEYVESAHDLGAELYNASTAGVNPFDLDGLSQKERTGELTAMLKRIFRLGEVQSYVLYKCISYSYDFAERSNRVPGMPDLLYTIRVFKAHAQNSEKRILESLEKRFTTLEGAHFSRGVELGEVMGGRSIFALSSLHTNEAQSLYIESFLKKVYTSMLSHHGEGKRRFYILIDEAEKLLESSILSRIVAEGRKYGIGIVCISQRAKALNRELRSNAALTFAFSQREPEELNYLANLISGGNEMNRFAEVKRGLRNLKRGHCMVTGSGMREPQLVKLNLFSEQHRDPTHQILTLAMQAVSKRELRTVLLARGYELSQMNLALSGALLKSKIESHSISEGPYAGTWYITKPRNSAEHDILLHLISRHLKKIGIGNRIYNSSYGPDIVAFINRAKIAVEYETGKNAFDQAKAMIEGRRQKFQRVIVVVNPSSLVRYRCIEGIELFSPEEFLSLSSLRDLSEEDVNAPHNPAPSGVEG